MPFNKGKYDTEYNKTNVTRKFIPFNKNNPEDVALLDWLNRRDNVTAYVKQLIKQDIKHRFLLSEKKDPAYVALFSKIRSQNGSQAGE